MSDQVGTYVRRRELTCTLAELEANKNVVLLPSEVLYVNLGDGTYDLKIGDGQTTVGNLPYVIRMSDLRTIQETVERLVSSVDPDGNGVAADSDKLGGVAASEYPHGSGGVKSSHIDSGAVTTEKIGANAVTNAKLAKMAARTIKGNPSTASADPQDMTVEATRNLLGIPAHNYEYTGRDLSTIFTAAQLHAAVAAGDFTNIRVGDYWPITLNGTIYDYAGAAEKTLSNAIIKLEVAGVNFYRQYGDTAVPNHLLFCSRDLLPWTLMFRSENTTWYDTAATNPWLGSHLYQTLNNPSNGLLPLVAATDIGAYIYAGPNGNGMRFLGETKGPTATTATGWAWADRGKLFLPSEREVWGGDTWSEHSYGGGLALQWPIFAGTMRHIIKGLGNGGSRYYWWCCSSIAGSSGGICYVTYHGYPHYNSATFAWVGAPVCFLFS